MGQLKRLVGAACVAVLLLSGCSSGEQEPQSSLSALEEQLYQDVFEIYERCVALEYATVQQGGTEFASPEIKKCYMGSELEWVEWYFKRLWDMGLSYAGTNVDVIEGWRRAPEPDKSTGAFISIEECTRHEKTDSLNPDGSVHTPALSNISHAVVFFARDTDNVIKIYDRTTEKVEECPF
ncbi:MAG: hypothetical protein LBC29_06010 [Propionibacteriaceae bacterium]|nr:hypothetical protein [Propionibacteriaceae bacterium]